MCRIMSFVGGCILVVCSVPVAAAQTSAQFSRADKYKTVKAVLQSSYEKEGFRSSIRESQKGEYDLAAGSPQCKYTSDYLGFYDDDDRVEKPQHANDDIADFVLIAVSIVNWENDLRMLGLPEPIWRPVLERYEAEQLSSDPISDETDLVAELNANMARAGKSTPKFVFSTGCGDSGIDVRFALEPPAGQLFLIPVFLYKVCQVQHLNPLDFKSCDRWKEILNEHVWDINGDYMYLARWTDGVVRCGLFTSADFRKTDEKRTGTQGRVVITKLRSPECSRAL